jgi:copper(I)-binding protein
LTVTNTGNSPDKLVGGSSSEVDHIEVHEMSLEGGVMRMRPVSGGIAIEPGKTVILQPGGFHLMLIGPKRSFKVGEHIPATLKFEHAGEVKVDFYVQGDAPKPESHDISSMKDMH